MEPNIGGTGTSTRHFALRNSIATAFAAVALASICLHVWLVSDYGRTLLTKPERELGIVHALNIHGTYVYLTDAETTGLSLTLGAFGLGIMLFAIVVPKDYVPGVGLLALKTTNRRQ